ncbi:hypothetical protein Taro_051961 [Colocasia esculenta]|uniref:Protein kinase domain-containing protein n=1 Tax=Colocasia esculenta TaxID=4460 RepID=A0A843XIC7_COLES|nr:hypothetical protein [Colocasia esculenta]
MISIIVVAGTVLLLCIALKLLWRCCRRTRLTIVLLEAVEWSPVHVNLVHLRGFCSEGTKRQLVYDYMLDGCLDHHLFYGNVMALNWRRRFTIVLKGAKELAYLHEKYKDCIITANILLDGDFQLKMEDMGIAKLVGRDYSTVLRGTYG